MRRDLNTRYTNYVSQTMNETIDNKYIAVKFSVRGLLFPVTIGLTIELEGKFFCLLSFAGVYMQNWF